MKINVVSAPRFSRFSIILAIASGLFISTVSAVPVQQYDLTLTENSSTSLSLAYTGPGGTANFMVTPGSSPDTWTIQSLSMGINFFEFTWDWIEPEEPNEVNEAYTGDNTLLHSSFTVESDKDIAEYGGGVGTTLSDGSRTPTAVGQDGTTPIFLTFIDRAAANEAATGVPESGNTLVLLAGSGLAMVAFRRFRGLRLA